MSQNNKLFFNIIRDIYEDINQYEENALHILSRENISVYEAQIIQAIIYLKAQGANITSQVAKHLNASKSSISIAIKNMEKKGLITRKTDKNDRRKSFLLPTEKSIKINDIYTKIHKDFIQKGLDALDDFEKKTFIRLSILVRNHIRSLIQ